MDNTPTGPDIFEYDNPEWARQFILQLRYGLGAEHNERMVQITRAFINGHLRFPPPPGDPEAEADCANLSNKGYCCLGPVLADEQISEVMQFFQHSAYVDRTQNIFNLDRNTVLRAPYLRDIALSRRILHRVSRYLGVPPTVQTMLAWWSFHDRFSAEDAQFFHFDFHDFRWVKLFVYLTDVDVGSGPHVLVRGSHNRNLLTENLKNLANADPKSAASLKHIFETQNRLTDEAVETAFGTDRIVVLEGAAGEAFLVDTACYHKGMLPEHQDRLVFQTLFTMLPTIKDTVVPLEVCGGYEKYCETTGKNAADKRFWEYVTRLVMQNIKH